MIQKLRRKFIATNMLLVSAVLLAVFAVQTFSTFQRSREQVYRAMAQVLEWTKHASTPNFEFIPRHRELEPDLTAVLDSRMANLIPTFAVEVDGEGQVLSVQSGPGATVTRENAQTLVDQALKQPRGHGTIPGQNLNYLFQTDEDGRRFFAFADNTSVGQTMGNQVVVSLLISAAALLAFYLISRFLARVTLQPVERAWDQQRQFVADASHELKTPLAVILANTGIVLAHPSDTVEAQGKWIGYIQEEAQRMRALVEDLLFLAKSDAARLPAHPMEVRFSELVIGSLLPFESVAFEKGVTLSDHIAPNLTLWGDEAQLRRLVVILLDNAVKYAGENGSVSAVLSEAQNRVRLAVHNTGPAIPVEHLPHLFERFYRADTARDREQGGYGLGLSIAQSIAQTHGGKITVESGEGVGTTFTVTFLKRQLYSGTRRETQGRKKCRKRTRAPTAER